LSTTWLFILLVWVHVAYLWFPHQWAAFASGLGLCTVILLWPLRGRRWSLRWWVVMFGVEEGAQVAVCQMAQNWWPAESPVGMCSRYAGLPLHWWGLCAVVFLAHAIMVRNE
jgi:hypothetical protein